DLPDSTPRTLHLTVTIQPTAQVADDDESEEETPGTSIGDVTSHSNLMSATLKPIYVCGQCGQATLEMPAGMQCVNGCEGQVIAMLYHRGRITQCPACLGRYGAREIVTTFGTSVAASVAVLTSALMKRLDRRERRMLIFTDNRQDAAFQAGYL